MAMEKVSVLDVQKAKDDGRKLVMVTAYDYPLGLLAHEAGVDIVLVGDSLGMVVLGMEGTVGVTMEHMIHHTRAVVRGCKGRHRQSGHPGDGPHRSDPANRQCPGRFQDPGPGCSGRQTDPR